MSALSTAAVIFENLQSASQTVLTVNFLPIPALLPSRARYHGFAAVIADMLL